MKIVSVLGQLSGRGWMYSVGQYNKGEQMMNLWVVSHM